MVNWLKISKKAASLGALLAAGLALVLGQAPQVADASSHREAPLISEDPLADVTDVWFFVSPDQPDTVTIITNWIPLQSPQSGPNFWKFGDDVLYAIHLDNDGDALSDIDYEFRFTTTRQNNNTFLYNTGPITSLADPDWNIRQSLMVTRVDLDSGARTVIGRNLPTPPVNVGVNSIPDYAALANAAISPLVGGGRVFAGQRDDAFFADLGGIFDLLTIRGGPPGNTGQGIDYLAGFNVHTISLQLPITAITRNGTRPTDPADPAAVVGVWATGGRHRTRVLRDDGEAASQVGPFVQVSRLAMPLVNEAVIPLGMKDRFNASPPSQDGQFLSFVLDPEPAKLINLIYGVPVPPAPRNDLVQVFLTGVPGLNMPPGVVPAEMLRLNVAIPPSAEPNRFGVLGGDLAGYPNGRRLADDTVDITFQAAAGVLVEGFGGFPNNSLGDGVDGNDAPLLDVFPYQAHPAPGG
ncbi:MAG: DUF4331 domain-containing protein, partial [Deinococcus sp.]|nr:DUF4331 domain-containing protein [Deinococcus sp.]